MKLNKIGSNMLEATLADATRVLFSHETPVAAQLRDGSYLRTSTKWSATTSRHINKWLSGVKATEVPQQEIENLIKKD